MNINLRIYSLGRISLFSAYAILLFLLNGCITTDSSKTSSQTGKSIILAVWDFDNNSPPGGELDYLGKTLAEELISQLSTAANIRLVEREQLRQILQEQHLSASQLASDETRLRLGRLAGANHMLFGSYVALGEQIRIDLRVVEVETTLTKFSESVVSKTTDSINGIIQLANVISVQLAH